MKIMKNISHYSKRMKCTTTKNSSYSEITPAVFGDLLAIPFFALSFYYFYNLEDKTNLENILMFFSLAGLILDCLFSAIFLCKSI